jgi:hypothetical protein
MPVQTAYAAPTSSLRSAMLSRQKLISAHAAKLTVGPSRVSPWLSFSDTAKPVSNRPATTMINHVMSYGYRDGEASSCAGDGAGVEAGVHHVGAFPGRGASTMVRSAQI